MDNRKRDEHFWDHICSSVVPFDSGIFSQIPTNSDLSSWKSLMPEHENNQLCNKIEFDNYKNKMQLDYSSSEYESKFLNRQVKINSSLKNLKALPIKNDTKTIGYDSKCFSEKFNLELKTVSIVLKDIKCFLVDNRLCDNSLLKQSSFACFNKKPSEKCLCAAFEKDRACKHQDTSISSFSPKENFVCSSSVKASTDVSKDEISHVHNKLSEFASVQIKESSIASQDTNRLTKYGSCTCSLSDKSRCKSSNENDLKMCLSTEAQEEIFKHPLSSKRYLPPRCEKSYLPQVLPAITQKLSTLSIPCGEILCQDQKVCDPKLTLNPRVVLSRINDKVDFFSYFKLKPTWRNKAVYKSPVKMKRLQKLRKKITQQ